MHLKLEEPGFTFKTGQFLSLKVGENVFRSYSLHSKPGSLPFYEMFIDITPSGPGTTYIKNLEPGDIIETSKPVGIFTLQQNPGTYIFGATGCGISTIKPMIEELISINLQSQVYLFWGLRFMKDVVLKEEFKALQDKYPNFHLQIILSKPENTWHGKNGHITEHILELVKNLSPNETGVYLCGNSGLIDNTRDRLNKINFPAEKIIFEKYY